MHFYCEFVAKICAKFSMEGGTFIYFQKSTKKKEQSVECTSNRIQSLEGSSDHSPYVVVTKQNKTIINPSKSQVSQQKGTKAETIGSKVISRAIIKTPWHRYWVFRTQRFEETSLM